MKKGNIIGILLIIEGLLLAVGPYTLFKVCPTGDMIMKCYWSVRSVSGTGAVLAVLGLLFLLNKSSLVCKGISLSVMPVSALAIALPSFLIGGCAKSTMACQSLTFPCIYVIGGLAFLTGLIAFIKLNKE